MPRVTPPRPSPPAPPIPLTRILADAAHREPDPAVRRWLRRLLPATDGSTIYGSADFDGGGRHKNPLANPLGAALDFWENCRRVGLVAHLERSGGGLGWHTWLFFDAPMPAALVRKVLFALLPAAE